MQGVSELSLDFVNRENAIGLFMTLKLLVLVLTKVLEHKNLLAAGVACYRSRNLRICDGGLADGHFAGFRNKIDIGQSELGARCTINKIRLNFVAFFDLKLLAIGLDDGVLRSHGTHPSQR